MPEPVFDNILDRIKVAVKCLGTTNFELCMRRREAIKSSHQWRLTKFQLIILKVKDTLTIEICENIVSSDEKLLSSVLSWTKISNFNDHTKMLRRKAASQLAVLQRFSNCLDLGARMAIFRCFILSHFSYCNLVWHFCGATNTAKLERLQYRALKFVFQDWNSSYEDLLKKSDLPTLELARKRSIILEVYKAQKGISPSFMRDFFVAKESKYNLRRTNQLCVNHCRTKAGMKSLSVYGASLWKQLTDDFKNCDLNAFKLKLQNWYPTTCKCSACDS